MKLTGFDGQTALVTGAAGGIGGAVVQALVDAGARVIATDTAAALARADGNSRADWQPLDLCDATGVARLVDAAGPLRLVVHAAAVLEVGALCSLDPAAWQRMVDVNLTGSFTLLTAAGRALAAQGGGAMVVVSSNAAGVPRLGIGGYGATKAGVTMLARCLGLELAGAGVRVNIVAPGSTLTPMQTALWGDAQAGAAAVIAGDLARFRTGIPLGKLATPQDIAAACLFLLSDQSTHVTMADLYVDGGGTLRG
ncbi:SDR family oxidoreductase [Paracoccus sp. p3-h83]|uniref:SDR family oxidoreductase n=1 Tax=Paracoccus sp. p3-h83 TaxID=3342805 RepID=UPI0035B7E3E5